MELTELTVKELKNVLIAYNKSVRKLTYKGVSKMKKADVVALLEKDFKPLKREKSINLKHKSGRFTKKLTKI